MAHLAIGTRLRQERERQSLSLDEIAVRTKIQPRFLQAIEANDLSPFPGIVFARNFVRQYALALGLDAEPLLAEMPRLDQSSVPLPDPPPRPRAQRTRLTNPLWTSAGWALAAVAAASGAWVYHNEDWLRGVIGTFTRRPVAVEAAKQVPAAHTTPAPEPMAPQDAMELPVSYQLPSLPALADEPGTPEVPASVQVTVTAREAAWVSVTADSKSKFIGTLKPHETKEISATDQVKIRTGNAGGIVLSLNGKTLDPIGPRGQVRTVMLTAEGPELLSANPDSPETPPEDPL